VRFDAAHSLQESESSLDVAAADRAAAVQQTFVAAGIDIGTATA